MPCSAGPSCTLPRALDNSTNPDSTVSVVRPPASTSTSQSVPRTTAIAAGVCNCSAAGVFLVRAHRRPATSSSRVRAGCDSHRRTCALADMRICVRSASNSAADDSGNVRTSAPALSCCASAAGDQGSTPGARVCPWPASATISAAAAPGVSGAPVHCAQAAGAASNCTALQASVIQTSREVGMGGVFGSLSNQDLSNVRALNSGAASGDSPPASACTR